MRILVFIFLLSSCSANWHLNKAVKKGAELEKVVVPVYVYDTIIDTVDNKIYIRTRIKDTIYDTKTIVKYVPKTRVQYKYDHKKFKDSIKYYNRKYRDSLDAALATTRIENRTIRKKDNRVNRFLWWFMIVFLIIIIVAIALNRIFK
jgi:hypothetical protein